MAKGSPQEIAQRWANRLAGATTEIQNGVNAVTVSPTQKAAAKQAKMLANLTASVQSGKWARGLQRVTLQDWQKSFIEKGLPRISQGAQQAQPKFAEFMSQLLPYQDTIRAKLSTMPDNTIDDSIARMSTYVREMAKFTKK